MGVRGVVHHLPHLDMLALTLQLLGLQIRHVTKNPMAFVCSSMLPRCWRCPDSKRRSRCQSTARPRAWAGAVIQESPPRMPSPARIHSLVLRTPLCQHRLELDLCFVKLERNMQSTFQQPHAVCFGRMAPTVPVSDIDRAVDFYTGVLGFSKVFENGSPVGFVILEKDASELHLSLFKGHKATGQNVAHLMVQDTTALGLGREEGQDHQGHPGREFRAEMLRFR